LKNYLSVILANAGIQSFQQLLDSCLRRNDIKRNFFRGFSFLDIIYPKRCASCESIVLSSDTFCKNCEGLLNPFDNYSFKLPLKPTYFDKAYSIYPFEGPMLNILHKFKYNRRVDLCKSLIDEVLKKLDLTYDFIIPVPMDRFRLIQRGYNQSLLLARALSSRTGVPMLINTLIKKHIKRQVGMSREGRLKNISGNIYVNPKYFEKIDGSKVLVLDDVVTTGATLNECAKVLKGANAALVDIFAIARTL
ncbi:ComF family protein, partial [bacterium]|nr:ComF family protein [bacterium]